MLDVLTGFARAMSRRGMKSKSQTCGRPSYKLCKTRLLDEIRVMNRGVRPSGDFGSQKRNHLPKLGECCLGMLAMHAIAICCCAQLSFPSIYGFDMIWQSEYLLKVSNGHRCEIISLLILIDLIRFVSQEG